MIMGIIIRNFVKMMIKFVQVKNKYMYIKHIDSILFVGHRHSHTYVQLLYTIPEYILVFKEYLISKCCNIANRSKINLFWLNFLKMFMYI